MCRLWNELLIESGVCWYRFVYIVCLLRSVLVFGILLLMKVVVVCIQFVGLLGDSWGGLVR